MNAGEQDTIRNTFAGDPEMVYKLFYSAKPTSLNFLSICRYCVICNQRLLPLTPYSWSAWYQTGIKEYNGACQRDSGRIEQSGGPEERINE
jgi:hypothetical protein